MATIKNDRDISLQATSPRLIGTSLSISSDQGSFTKVKNGGISPTSILLTAIPSGLTAPTYQWYYASSNTPSSWTAISGATSITYSITSSLYTTHRSTGSSVTYKCTATQAGWTSADYTTTILYVAQADDTPLVLLSKEAISVPSNSTGTSMTYTGSSCTIRASLSGIFLPYSASGPASFSVSVSATNIASGAQTVSTTTVADDTLNFGVLSSMASGTSIVANITYTITVRDGNNTAFTFTKVQTITKAPTGNTGDTGVPGAPGAPGTPGAPGDPGAAGDRAVFAYRILSSSSLPSAPSIVQSTVPNSGTAVVSTTWYLQPKSTALSSNEWMFQVSGTVSVLGDYTWQTQGYLSTFKVGALSALSADLGTITGGSIALGNPAGTYNFEVTSVGYTYIKNGDFSQLYCDTGSSNGLYVQVGGTAAGIVAYANPVSSGPGLIAQALGSGDAAQIVSAGSGYALQAHQAASGSTKAAIYSQQDGNEVAVYGKATGGASGKANASGIKGWNTYSGAGGLIGTNTGYDFYADGAGTGGGGSTSYGPFTGGHDALIDKKTVLEVGDIVMDLYVAVHKSISDTITVVELTRTPMQKAAVGVLTSNTYRDLLADTSLPAALRTKKAVTKQVTKDTLPKITKESGKASTKEASRPQIVEEVEVEDVILVDKVNALRKQFGAIIMNSVGEGQVNVCGESGDLEPGDLITSSSIPGKGMKQSDDIIRNYTVAKCREHIKFDNPTQVKMVACIYLCG